MIAARDRARSRRRSLGPYLAAFLDLGTQRGPALEGRFDEARSSTQRALDRFRAFGMRAMAATCEQSLASIELSAGQASAALAALCAPTRSSPSSASVAALHQRRRCSRAPTPASTSRRGAGGDRSRGGAQCPRRAPELRDHVRCRSRLALLKADPDAAERAARRSLGYALQTDFPGSQAEARLELARVLTATDRAAEAGAEARAALALSSPRATVQVVRRRAQLLEQLARR